MKKVRNFFRNDTYALDDRLLKILFTIGTFKSSDWITQKLLSSILKTHQSTLNYQITKLRDTGLIDYQNQLTGKGTKAIQYFMHWDKTLSKKLRAHKIQIGVNLLKLPTNFFKIKHTILTPFTNKRYQGLKGQLKGAQVLFYSSKKLMVKIPDIFGNTNEEIIAAVDDCMQQLFTILTKEFPGIMFNDYEICKFNSMHVAILDSIIAESHLLKNGTYQGGNGLAIDGSHGVPELEVEKLYNITENIEILIKYEDLVRENRRLSRLLEKQSK